MLGGPASQHLLLTAGLSLPQNCVILACFLTSHLLFWLLSAAAFQLSCKFAFCPVAFLHDYWFPCHFPAKFSSAWSCDCSRKRQVQECSSLNGVLEQKLLILDCNYSYTGQNSLLNARKNDNPTFFLVFLPELCYNALVRGMYCYSISIACLFLKLILID